jgi:hypothetical protein
MNFKSFLASITIFAPLFSLIMQSSVNAKSIEPTAYTQNNSVVIENAQCRLDVDAKTGEIKSLTPGTSTLSGKWFEVVIESRNDMKPWETWKHGTDNPFTGYVSHASTSVTKGAAYIHLEWLTQNGINVKGEIKLRTADKGPLFQLTVSNIDEASLVDTIRLPALKGISLDIQTR